MIEQSLVYNGLLNKINFVSSKVVKYYLFPLIKLLRIKTIKLIQSLKN